MRAFERQEGESQKAYQAFQKYLELGPERTLALATDAVYGRHKSGKRTQPAGQITKWARLFDWHDRAHAWDDLLHMTKLEGIQQAEREKAVDLAQRSQKLDEDILELKEAFIPKLKQMLQFPLARTTKESKDGKEITNVYPARWSYNTVVNALLALKDAPEGMSVNVNVNGEQAGGPIAHETRELDRYIAELEAGIAASSASETEGDI
jgi:hypothetical protein